MSASRRRSKYPDMMAQGEGRCCFLSFFKNSDWLKPCALRGGVAIDLASGIWDLRLVKA